MLKLSLLAALVSTFTIPVRAGGGSRGRGLAAVAAQTHGTAGPWSAEPDNNVDIRLS